MKNESELKQFNPIDIVSIDGAEALGVFDLPLIKSIQDAARNEKQSCPRCGKTGVDIHTCSPKSETPRTDAIAKGIGRIYAETRGRETSTIEFVERVQVFIDNSVGQLEQELNEARQQLIVEHDELLNLQTERDQLRRVVDELAAGLIVTHRETGCKSQCPVTAVLELYSQLPHVKQKETK